MSDIPEEIWVNDNGNYYLCRDGDEVQASECGFRKYTRATDKPRHNLAEGIQELSDMIPRKAYDDVGSLTLCLTTQADDLQDEIKDKDKVIAELAGAFVQGDCMASHMNLNDVIKNNATAIEAARENIK